MATSKGRGGAASKKSAATKKSSAPTKASGRSGAASTSRAASKAATPARGGAASKASKSSGSARGGASKAVAAKSATKGATKNAKSASKSVASKGTASKSAASKNTAARKTAIKGVAAKSASKSTAASRNGSLSRSSSGRGTAVKSSLGRASAARGGAASRNTSARSSSSRATAASADPRNDLENILQDMMKDIYYAEKKLVKALGKMSKNASDPKLKEAFLTHQSQTEDHIAKLEEAFALLGMQPKAKKCAAMDGLLEESDEHIKEYSKGAGLDAAMIVGAQKVEHYEIAAYGSMRSFSRTLGYKEAAMIFEEIREQESDTDELLTNLAESVINPRAEEETEDVSDSPKSSSGNSGGRGSEDSEAGEDSSSRTSGRNGREGGDDTMALTSEEMGSISGMTDGNNREGASETGPAMGY